MSLGVAGVLYILTGVEIFKAAVLEGTYVEEKLLFCVIYRLKVAKTVAKFDNSTFLHTELV